MDGTRQTLGYRTLFGYVRWVFTACYCRRFEVHGAEHIPPDGPLIIVGTHQNNLPDALAILFATSRRPVFVARADYFRQPLANRAMRFLRILPMPRADHGRRAIETGFPVTMGQLREHLLAGGACAILAEGSSLRSREVRPLKKSWARLALDALPEADGLAVVPVAVEYSDWDRWGPDVRVRIGEPVAVEPAPEDETPRHLAAMNERIHARLAALVSGDAEIETWHQRVTDHRRTRDLVWRVLGLPALAAAVVLLFPVLLLAWWAVRTHPRDDFQSTLEVGILTVGTPIWTLALGVGVAATLGLGAFMGGAVLLPLILWMASRCAIAWIRSR